MADDDDRWISAAQALRRVTDRIAAGLGLVNSDAWQEAENVILERLAAGTLRATPRGFLSSYEGQESPVRYWFELRQIEPDGRESPNPPIMEPDWDACCIPTDFWRVFKQSAAASRADWASGDFYISEFEDTSGNWSGFARDVHFDQDGLPGAGLTTAGRADQARSAAQRSEPLKKKGGAPTKYDWHKAIAYLVALANSPDGLDPTGRGREGNISYVGRLMEDWFDTQGVGRPGKTRLHQFAGIVVGAINDLRSAKE